MSELDIGILFAVGTLALLLSGMAVAFALGIMSLTFIFFFMPPALLHTIPEAIYSGINNFTLLAIPLFILMGEAVGSTKASVDLYESAYRWLSRLPGGLGIANVIGCAIFAAMCGSSTATSAAIGSMGIPEMQKRGYSGGLAGGLIAAGGTLGNLIPPSIPFILYGIVAEQSIGKLFVAGILPGLLLALMFSLWVAFKSYLDDKRKISRDTVGNLQTMKRETFSWEEKFETLPRLTPFILIITIVIVALYGGFATPSEVAGVGAFSTVLMVTVVYKCYRWKNFRPILQKTASESCMIVMIITLSFLYTYVMSYLHISQSTTQWLVGLDMSRWMFLFWIDVLVVVFGFFMPPVAIILFVTPVILPALRAHGFDPIWFGVQMTVLMEAGLIHPPIGLNLFVIQGIAPDIPLKDLLWGVTPFIILILLFIIIMCVWPQTALWLPSLM